MRALTLIRPMSAAIVHGTKRVENRPKPLPKWMRDNRVLVAVHAGAGWDRDYELACERIDGPGFYGERFADTGIVGAMILTGRAWVGRPEDQYNAGPWYSGPHGYEIEWAAALPEPIPCRGMLGFWTINDEKIERTICDLALTHGKHDFCMEPSA